MPDFFNGLIFAAAGIPVIIAQSTDPGIGSSLVQLGAIGVILAWLTLVDIPARNKAAAEREGVWQKQLEQEREAAARREAAFQTALDRHADALAEVARAIDGLKK